MGTTLKNITLGIAISVFVLFGMFSFAQNWTDRFSDVVISPDLQDIHGEIITTPPVMYAKAQDDSDIVEKSNVYTGATDIGVVTAEPYKAITRTKSLTKTAMNVTSQISRFGFIPDWVFTLAITAMMITITWLAISAVFRKDT
jgi:hypothetical protein